MNIVFELSIDRNKLIQKGELEKRKHYRNYLHHHQKEILKSILNETINKNDYECEWNYIHHDKIYEEQRREGELYSIGYIKEIEKKEIEEIEKRMNEKVGIKKENEKTFNYMEKKECVEWYEEKIKNNKKYEYVEIVKKRYT